MNSTVISLSVVSVGFAGWMWYLARRASTGALRTGPGIRVPATKVCEHTWDAAQHAAAPRYTRLAVMLVAIAAAESFKPEVILMDVGMPRLNGYEAAQRIRGTAHGKDMAIVALTGWGQDGDRERSRAAGCDGHLVKPVALEELERLLTTLRPDALG